MYRYIKAAVSIISVVGICWSDAVADTAPVSTQVTVSANQSWQPSGVVVGPGSTVKIVAEGGAWTASPATGMVSAGGNPQFIAKPGYTFPGAHEGELIGRVGGTPFVVGMGTTVPAGLSGPLEFCIDDDIQQRYGAGLADNIGAITVKITH